MSTQIPMFTHKCPTMLIYTNIYPDIPIDVYIYSSVLIHRSPVTYTNWSWGDPNDGARRRNEDCAMINSGGKGKWNDWPCSTQFYALCKITAG